MEDGIESFINLGGGNQFLVEFFVYCDFIDKGFIDGYVAVIGYGREQEVFGGCQGEKGVELDSIFQEGNFLRIQDGIDNGFGYGD